MRRRVSTAAVALVLAGGLIACGGEPETSADNGIVDMRPVEVLEAADEAMAALDDITYEGTAPWSDGSRAKTLDVYVIGKAYQRTQSNSRLGGFTRLCIGLDSWSHYNLRWYRRVTKMAPAQAKYFASTWLATPRGVLDCADQELVPEPAARETFRAGDVVSVDGRPALRLDGEDDRGAPLTLWIATQGKPLVLRAAGGVDEETRWDRSLTQTNSGVELSRPPASRIRER